VKDNIGVATHYDWRKYLRQPEPGSVAEREALVRKYYREYHFTLGQIALICKCRAADVEAALQADE
jgi:hypothetical protein